MAPLVLLILDGWGIAKSSEGNAIAQAKAPTYQRLLSSYPTAVLDASGSAVGLPAGQVGNSEAGHMNIGAGRVVPQDAVRINEKIEDGTFFKNPAFIEALDFAAAHKGRLHLVGLLSASRSGHMYPTHIDALLDLARSHDHLQVFLHLFTDGRDTPQQAARKLVPALEKKLKQRESVATLMGRLWGMDRAKRWDRTGRAYAALLDGSSEQTAPTALAAVEAGYTRGETDEFLSPVLIGNPAVRAESRIKDGDSIIFFNLRSDRARQLTKPFVQEHFEAMNEGAFRRGKTLTTFRFIAMTDFGPDLPKILTAFPSANLRDTLPMQLGDLRQLYIAEAEKYAHITFFLNGGYANPVAGEQRVMVPSADVRSFAEAPTMATPEIADHIVSALTEKQHDIIVANFANADMVGHTGDVAAGVAAVESIDAALERVWSAVRKHHGTLIVTADHGNIETMTNRRTGGPDTEHNTNPVPFIVATDERTVRLRKRGALCDVAPTVLALLTRAQPAAMTGHSLLQ